MTHNLMAQADRSLRRVAARRRGVALIMVAVLLTVIFVLAIAFVSASRMDRVAGRGHNYDDSADVAIEALTKQVGNILTRDRLNEMTNANAVVYTYPDAQHPWLATIDGRDDDRRDAIDAKCIGPWTVWPQVSLIGGQFVNAGTMEPLGTDPTMPFGILFDDTTTWPQRADGTYDPETPDKYADAGGSGVADAKWVKLDLPGPEGLIWVVAARIIDNSGMVNLNTATQTTWDYRDFLSNGVSTQNDKPMTYRLFMADAMGYTPADIDLFGMLVNLPWDQTADGHHYSIPNPWTNPWQYVTGDAFASVWPYYRRELRMVTMYDQDGNAFQAIARDPSGRPLYDEGNITEGFLGSFHVGYLNSETAAGRRDIWNKVGSRLPELLGVSVSPNATSQLSPATPFGFLDEAELRMRYGANTCMFRVDTGHTQDGTPVPWPKVYALNSSLEWIMGGPGYGDQTVMRANGPPFTSPNQLPVDYRHLVTCYNGEAQTQNGAGGTYRGVMPNWVRSATGGTWRAKLDPNHDLGTDLATLFDGLLKATTTPGSSGGGSLNHYLGDTTGTEATKAAYSLAANLVAYRNAGHDPSDAMVGSYCGLEPQPFFVEATTAYVHKTDPTSTTTAAGVPLLLIELRNPFVNSKTPVNLSKFRLSVGTAATSTAANSFALPNYDLKPGEMVVLYTEGDDELVAFLDQVGVPATRRVAIPAQGVLPDPPVFCLYTNDQPKVMVDRLRNAVWDPNTKKLVANTTPSGRWAARNRGGTPVIQPGKWQITSSTLWRDTRASGPTGSVFGGGATGAPCYVIEALNNQVNKAASNSPVEVPPGAYVDPSQSGGPFGPAFLPGICGTAGRFSKPSATAPPALPGVFQLPIKDAPLDTLGELLLLPTVAHTTGASGRPFSEGMLERYQLVFANGAVAALIKDSYFGALWTNLDWTHYVRSSSPNLPVAVTLFDGLDILGPQTNVPILPGRININTAPAKVIARLPWMHRYLLLWKTPYQDSNNVLQGETNRLSDSGFRGSDVMVAYRDMTDLPDDDPSDPMQRTYKDRALCGIADLSKTPGYRSVGEPLLVRRAMKDASGTDLTAQQLQRTLDWRMDRFGVNGETEKPLPPDNWGQVGPCPDATPDDVVDDVKEISLLFNRMSNLITIHSDTFTASVVLQGRRLNPATRRYEPVLTRRFVAAFDRTPITATDPTTKVLYLSIDRDNQVPAEQP